MACAGIKGCSQFPPEWCTWKLEYPCGMVFESPLKGERLRAGCSVGSLQGAAWPDAGPQKLYVAREGGDRRAGNGQVTGSLTSSGSAWSFMVLQNETYLPCSAIRSGEMTVRAQTVPLSPAVSSPLAGAWPVGGHPRPHRHWLRHEAESSNTAAKPLSALLGFSACGTPDIPHGSLRVVSLLQFMSRHSDRARSQPLASLWFWLCSGPSLALAPTISGRGLVPYGTSKASHIGRLASAPLCYVVCAHHRQTPVPC